MCLLISFLMQSQILTFPEDFYFAAEAIKKVKGDFGIVSGLLEDDKEVIHEDKIK